MFKMQAVIKHKSILPLPAAQLWGLLAQTDTLRHVADGFVTYHGEMPPKWRAGDQFDIKPKFQKFPWSLIPEGSHEVQVTQVDPERRCIETLESGGVVTYWNHVMKIDTFIDSQFCLYTDHVIIEAGVLTPLVFKLADQLYRHRHEKWCELATIHAKQT